LKKLKKSNDADNVPHPYLIFCPKHSSHEGKKSSWLKTLEKEALVLTSVDVTSEVDPREVVKRQLNAWLHAKNIEIRNTHHVCLSIYVMKRNITRRKQECFH
jgi:hypothetical protein